MDKYTATELAFKNGYEKGYEAGQSDVAAECQSCAKATKEVIESLQRKTATENNVGCKWIPVAERLPERGQEVIVASYRTINPVVFTMNFWEKEHDNWVGITHWMPLPEPPKEGE